MTCSWPIRATESQSCSNILPSLLQINGVAFRSLSTPLVFQQFAAVSSDVILNICHVEHLLSLWGTSDGTNASMSSPVDKSSNQDGEGRQQGDKDSALSRHRWLLVHKPGGTLIGHFLLRVCPFKLYSFLVWLALLIFSTSFYCPVFRLKSHDRLQSDETFVFVQEQNDLFLIKHCDRRHREWWCFHRSEVSLQRWWSGQPSDWNQQEFFQNNQRIEETKTKMGLYDAMFSSRMTLAHRRLRITNQTPFTFMTILSNNRRLTWQDTSCPSRIKAYIAKN